MTKPSDEGEMALFHRDKRNTRPGEKIGGGFIVARRGRDSGRFRMNQWPFEHDSYDDAVDEANRLAAQNPGRGFAILQQVSPEFAIPAPINPTTDET